MAGAGIRLGIMAVGILRIGMAAIGAAGTPAIGVRGIIIRILIGAVEDGITHIILIIIDVVKLVCLGVEEIIRLHVL